MRPGMRSLLTRPGGFGRSSAPERVGSAATDWLLVWGETSSWCYAEAASMRCVRTYRPCNAEEPLLGHGGRCSSVRRNGLPLPLSEPMMSCTGRNVSHALSDASPAPGKFAVTVAVLDS